MCQLCEQKSVYEFTNKRKLCKRCYIRWFEKKFLYTIRKYDMIKKNEFVLIESRNNFRDVVLLHLLKFYFKQLNVKMVENTRLKSFILSSFSKPCLSSYGLSKFDKIAISNNLDLNSYGFVKLLRKNPKKKEFEKFLPVYRKIIQPLFLFLDKEILLYAKLKELKYKKFYNSESFFPSSYSSIGLAKVEKRQKNKHRTSLKNIDDDKLWNEFIDELEKKHPELKSALMNSCLKIFYERKMSESSSND